MNGKDWLEDIAAEEWASIYSRPRGQFVRPIDEDYVRTVAERLDELADERAKRGVA